MQLIANTRSRIYKHSVKTVSVKNVHCTHLGQFITRSSHGDGLQSLGLVSYCRGIQAHIEKGRIWGECQPLAFKCTFSFTYQIPCWWTCAALVRWYKYK